MTRLQKDTMQMIIESGDLLVAIVNDVLDYAKLETGSFELEIRKSSLEQTLGAILHSIETKSQSRGQSVRQQYSTSLPQFVHVDSRRVQQILYNLLGNAIKFSSENSVIDFTVDYMPSTLEHSKTKLSVDLDTNLLNKCDAPAPLTRAVPLGYDTTATRRPSEACGGNFSSTVSTSSFTSESVTMSTASERSNCPFHRSTTNAPEPLKPTRPGEDRGKVDQYDLPAIPNAMTYDPATCFDPRQCIAPNMLRFVVKDYGRGIPKGDYEKIFKPFQQVSNIESVDVHGGTGLGLAITYRLVTAMGGVISVDSELGAWSEFTVDLPCCDPPADMVAFKSEMQNCMVVVVGAEGLDRERAQRIFESFEIHYAMFDSMEELQSEFLEQNLVCAEITYVCLIQEDAYGLNPEPYTMLSKMTRSTLVMFGDQFRADSGNHLRCLQKTIPSVLIVRLLETLRGVEDKPPDESKVRVPYEKIRVLVAEDNKINQKVLQRMLVRLGVKDIDIVENGKLAVERESVNEYDIVLMDQQMPVMGGIAACRHIVNRTGGHAKKPFIVFVTAHVSSDFEAQAYEAGCTDFLPKPCKLEHIAETFEKLFAGSLPGPRYKPAQIRAC